MNIQIAMAMRYRKGYPWYPRAGPGRWSRRVCAARAGRRLVELALRRLVLDYREHLVGTRITVQLRYKRVV